MKEFHSQLLHHCSKSENKRNHLIRQSIRVHKDLIVTTKQIWALLTAARTSGGKHECRVRLTGVEREYWMSTEIGRLGEYGFRGTVSVGDGSY